MWSGGGLTRGKVSPGWFHKCRTKCCRAITPPSNSTCENKHWCENLEKATRGEIEMCQSHLATGPRIESTEESFLHKASKMPLRSHRRQMVYQSSFILGEICEQYCAIAKENVSHIFCFGFLDQNKTGTKRRRKKAQRHHIEPATLSMNLAILTSRFDSPPQSCVVSVTWTYCEHRHTLCYCALRLFFVFRSRLVACCFPTSSGLPAASLHSSAASPVTLVARFRH